MWWVPSPAKHQTHTSGQHTCLGRAMCSIPLGLSLRHRTKHVQLKQTTGNCLGTIGRINLWTTLFWMITTEQAPQHRSLPHICKTLLLFLLKFWPKKSASLCPKVESEEHFRRKRLFTQSVVQNVDARAAFQIASWSYWLHMSLPISCIPATYILLLYPWMQKWSLLWSSAESLPGTGRKYPVPSSSKPSWPDTFQGQAALEDTLKKTYQHKFFVYEPGKCR